MTPEGRVVAALKRAAAEFELVCIRMSLRPGVAAGWPDFVILGPGGRVLWVETKAPGKPLRPLQDERRKTIEGLGGRYAKPDTVEDARRVVAKFAKECGL